MHRYLLPFILAGLASTGAAAAASPCPPGFAILQQGDTCMRISGRVRAEGVVGSPRHRLDDAVGTSANGRIQLDVRKKTEYGPLRAVIRAEGVRN